MAIANRQSIDLTYVQSIENNFEFDAILDAFNNSSRTKKAITWEITDRLQELYVRTRWLLLQEEPVCVWHTLITFIKYEVNLRHIVENQPLSQELLTNLNKIQKYYNLYRIRLLKDISLLFLDYYERAGSYMRINPDVGNHFLHRAQKFINFFINNLKMKRDYVEIFSQSLFDSTNVDIIHITITKSIIDQCLIKFQKMVEKGDIRLQKSLTEKTALYQNDAQDKTQRHTLIQKHSHLVKLNLAQRVKHAKTWNQTKYRNKYLIHHFKQRQLNKPEVKANWIRKIEAFKSKKELRRSQRTP